MLSGFPPHYIPDCMGHDTHKTGSCISDTVSEETTGAQRPGGTCPKSQGQGPDLDFHPSGSEGRSLCLPVPPPSRAPTPPTVAAPLPCGRCSGAFSARTGCALSFRAPSGAYPASARPEVGGGTVNWGTDPLDGSPCEDQGCVLPGAQGPSSPGPGPPAPTPSPVLHGEGSPRPVASSWELRPQAPAGCTHLDQVTPKMGPHVGQNLLLFRIVLSPLLGLFLFLPHLLLLRGERGQPQGLPCPLGGEEA